MSTKENKYVKVACEIGELVTEKNIKYGDSFSKTPGILNILYPHGIKTEDYNNVLTLVRILDKISRIATNNDSDGESPFRDILGYCILALCNGKE